MKIAVAGTGYVGLSLSVLLAQRHQVAAVDVLQKKVDKINRGVSPIQDAEIERFLKEKHLNLIATRNAQEAYKDAEFVIISTPTNYDPVLNHFDTSSVESVIQLVKKVNAKATMVIKSTVPVGFTMSMRKKYATGKHIVFARVFERGSGCFMTICTPLESLWVVQMRSVYRQRPLRICYWKVRWIKKHRCC